MKDFDPSKLSIRLNIKPSCFYGGRTLVVKLYYDDEVVSKDQVNLPEPDELIIQTD